MFAASEHIHGAKVSSTRLGLTQLRYGILSLTANLNSITALIVFTPLHRFVATVIHYQW